MSTNADVTINVYTQVLDASRPIAKWGNSLGLRLPKSVAQEVQLDEGDKVELSVGNGAIVIRPSRPAYSLADLVSKITAKNRHDPVRLWERLPKLASQLSELIIVTHRIEGPNRTASQHQ